MADAAVDAENAAKSAPVEPEEPSTPLNEITVTVKAIAQDSNEEVSFEEPADAALKNVDDRLQIAKGLLKCLAS